MPRRFLTMLLAVCLLMALAPAARADDAGALSEGELNAWLDIVLRQSVEESPLNAPVGEESLTEDGYAFLYSFATLYYDKPTLDAKSRLKAVAVTDERFPAPRDIRLGADASAIMDSFGWQNPTLEGDGLFAALYELNDLPRAAYWSIAQLDQGALRSVQCGVHVQAADDLYTDAGLLISLEDGKVSDIRVYGLCDTVAMSDVVDNLETVKDAAAFAD